MDTVGRAVKEQLETLFNWHLTNVKARWALVLYIDLLNLAPCLFSAMFVEEHALIHSEDHSSIQGQYP